jgi:PAS domain-containing protein
MHNKLLERTVRERTAELRASEQRFHRLTELSSDWYWEQDASGRYVEVSGPAMEILGADGDPGSVGSGRALLVANIAARRPFLDLLYSRTQVDGSLQYFQVSGEPVISESGRYLGYRGIGVDVTQRRREH